MKTQYLNLIRTLWAVLMFADLMLLIGHEVKLYLPDVELWIEHMGFFAPLGFIFLFAILSPAFVSIDALCFAAGVLFPLITGELVVLISTFLSAAIMFYLGRNFLRKWVLRWIAGNKRFTTLNRLLTGKNEFKLMFLLHLTPLPFALLNYALSVTKVSFRPYLAATSGILIYNGSLVYFGYATKHLTGLIIRSEQTGFAPYSALVIGLIVLIVTLIYIIKIAGNALKEMNMDNFSE